MKLREIFFPLVYCKQCNFRHHFYTSRPFLCVYAIAKHAYYPKFMPISKSQERRLFEMAKANNAKFPVKLKLIGIDDQEVIGILDENGHFEETGSAPAESDLGSDA